MSDSEESFRLKREQLIEYLKSRRAIKSREIEDAFLAIKRELFVDERMKELSYADDALPLSEGQTISQPSTIAIMLELLGLKKGMKVIEVGSGCGYVVALLSKIVGDDGKVVGVEIIKKIAEKSRENLKEAGIKNAEIINKDACEGFAEKFDRILISAGCPFVPKKIFDAAEEKGRIVAPVGDRYTQMLETITKFKDRPLKEQYSGSYFVFVPLKCKELKW